MRRIRSTRDNLARGHGFARRAIEVLFRPQGPGTVRTSRAGARSASLGARTLRSFIFGLAGVLFGLACEARESTPDVSEPADFTPTPAPPIVPPAATPLASQVVHHAQELSRFSPADLATLSSLDLALSESDQVGRLDTIDPDTTCNGLDLLALSEAAPAIRQLRISGCQAALHAGLGGFGSRLNTLELADVKLDAVLVGRLSQLSGLDELILTRVRYASAPLASLRKLKIRSLTLRELEPDSELAALIDQWPKTLTSLSLEGAWAGHQTMLQVPGANALRRLVLSNTQVTNFSLNRIKGLTDLREVNWSGRAFNDRSPMYIRDLPVARFRCACPNLGDIGLRNLRRVKTLRTLELLESEVTDQGVVELADLADLRELTILGRDLGSPAMEAIATLTKLESLHLGGVPFSQVDLTPLGQLSRLRRLELAIPNLDDAATSSLGELGSLEELCLGHTQISDQTLPRIGKLGRLRRLELHHTRVTRALDPLTKLRNLEILELDHTDLVDVGVAHLIGLPNLRELRLDETLVTDGAISALARLPALTRINLAETVVSSEAAAKLWALPELRTLTLTARE